MQEENGFYVILPSYSDPDVHPDNTASNFRLNYQNPIRFDQPKEWKVALAEMTYYHSPYTISKQQGFEYDATFDLRVQITYDGEKKSYNMNILNKNPPTVSIVITEDAENVFEVVASLPFTLAFDWQSESSYMGFTYQKSSLDNLRYPGNNFLLRAQYPNWFKSNMNLNV